MTYFTQVDTRLKEALQKKEMYENFHGDAMNIMFAGLTSRTTKALSYPKILLILLTLCDDVI